MCLKRILTTVYTTTRSDAHCFAVTAILYKGVNCDGIHGSCAEYITVGIAVSNGERCFDTIVAVHDKAPNKVIPPCGNCRQMLFEYCPDIKVIVNDENGKLVKIKARDLLPFAWQPVEC